MLIITAVVGYLFKTKEVQEEKYQSASFETRYQAVTEIFVGDTFKLTRAGNGRGSK